MDDPEEEPVRVRTTAARDGYRAGARLRESHGSRTRVTVLALVAVVGAGVAFAKLDSGPAAIEATAGPSRAASQPSRLPSGSASPSGSPYPALAILGQPVPTRPVPLHSLWLRWLDPATADLGGDVPPPNVTTPIDIVDAGGHAIQVCPASGEPDQSYLPQGLDLCSFDENGTGTGRVPLMAFGRFDPGGLTTDVPVEYDATVSHDGRWLWVVAAYPHPADWFVEAVRVDLSTRTVAGRRRLRTLPIGEAGSATLSPDGWLVPPGTGIWPVVRASPSGQQLSVTVLAGTGPPDAPDAVVGQERLVLDSSLDGSPIAIASRYGAATDSACDPLRAAWATEDQYLTICQHGNSEGTVQPFVRIESRGDVTRDVAIGPALLGPEGSSEGSSWLLDSQTDTIYRWVSSRLALSRLNVRTRDGSAVVLTDAAPAIGAIDVPAGGVLADGSITWTPMGRVGMGKDGLQLAGTADGRILYALGVLPGGVDGVDASGHAVVWVVDAGQLRWLAQWNAPGPVDQMAVGPGGAPLVELVTPALDQRAALAGPASDWTTQLWFVDERSGKPLELAGQLRGPGTVAPALLSPVVGTLAGF